MSGQDGRVTPHYADDWLTVYHGDAKAVLAELPAESVHCVVTSPPYWGLRDYGTASWEGGDEACDHSAAKRKTRYDYPMESSPIQQASRTGTDAQSGMYARKCPACGAIRQDSQLGLEPTPEQYVENMVAVFREVRRVLRSDGTVWLNLGDSYAAQRGGTTMPAETIGGGEGGWMPDGSRVNRDRHDGYTASRNASRIGLKHKDLVGIPWRVAFALQADGWYLRSDIIWSKPNPMPESVTDRPTKSHEMIFLLSKSARYYFDADAVREGVAESRVVQGPNGHRQPLVLGQSLGLEHASPTLAAVGVRLAAAILDLAKRKDNLGLLPLDAEVGEQGANDGAGALVVGVPVVRRAAAEAARFADGDVPAKEFLSEMDRLCIALPDGDDLKEAWRRVRRATRTMPAVDADGDGSVRVDDAGEVGKVELVHDEQYTARGTTSSGRNLRSVWSIATAPYPGAHFATFPPKLVEPCIKAGCPEGGTVLDPFAGSGTTGMVAQSLSRRAVLIDLSMDYLGQAMKRNREIPLGLQEAS